VARQKIQSSSHVVSEYPERFQHYLWYFVRIPLCHEFVPRTGDRKQFGANLDELQRGNHLVDGAEPIPRAMNEHRRGLDAREVPGP
jgi:hypothetical protein